MRFLLACLIGLCVAQAAGAEDFYQGKTITVVTSTGSGGTYDLVARMLSRHMPRHIPGRPTMIVQNMPGGGNLVATNYMYNVAPKDGTVIATVNMGIPLYQVIDGRGVRYDARKFSWLGSIGPINAVTIAWRGAGVDSIQDAMRREIVLGGTGPGSAIVIYPTAMNNLLGTKFKIVNGYKSSAEIYVAMEKGEVAARAGSLPELLGEHGDWVADRKISFLVQIGEERSPRLRDTPLMTELAHTPEQRETLKLISAPQALGQAYLAPPGVPQDRLAVLRDGLAAALADKEFLAETAKISLDIRPMSARKVAQIVAETVTAPPSIIAKAKAAVGQTE